LRKKKHLQSHCCHWRRCLCRVLWWSLNSSDLKSKLNFGALAFEMFSNLSKCSKHVFLEINLCSIQYCLIP
jgi:hypothetical protein